MKTSAGFLSIDDHGTIRAIDLFGQAITGYSAEMLVGKNIAMLLSPGGGEQCDFDLAAVDERVEIVGLEGEPVWVGRDGRPIDIELTRAEGQGVLADRFVATVSVPTSTIDDKMRMAELFMKSPMPMQSSDRDGRIEFVNDAWLSLLGYERDAVVGHSGREFMCDDDQWARLFDKLRRGEPVRGVEIKARRKDGRILSLLLHSNVARDSEGMAYTRSTLTDISELRMSERSARFQSNRNAALTIAPLLGVMHPDVLGLIGAACDSASVGVWLQAQERGVLTAVATWCDESLRGSSFDIATKVISIAPGVGLPGRAWQSNSPQAIADLQFDSNYLRRKESAESKLMCGAAFPLTHKGAVLGVIDFYSREPLVWDEDFQAELNALGASLGAILTASHQHTGTGHQ